MIESNDHFAFPNPNTQYRGMSLRDWFAGQALAGFTANTDMSLISNAQIATMAYCLADALLKAREAKS